MTSTWFSFRFLYRNLLIKGSCFIFSCVSSIVHMLTSIISTCTQRLWKCPRGVMVKAMTGGIVEREFVFHSRYHIHFQANALGKGMNPIIPPAMG